MEVTINTECPSCSGTGLYVGFMEAKGQAVICTSCGGTGCRKLTVKKYSGRKKKAGVTQIRSGSGTILDAPGRSAWFSYAEFETKIPAPKSEQ